MYHRQDQRNSVRTKRRTTQAFPCHSLTAHHRNSIINAGGSREIPSDCRTAVGEENLFLPAKQQQATALFLTEEGSSLIIKNKFT